MNSILQQVLLKELNLTKKLNMKNGLNKKSGFTIPEVIVAMAIMVLTVFASTNLVVSIIRSNSENVKTLIAYGLAQEGLEGFRNIRDSNWLLGGSFDGKIWIKGNPVSIWADEDLPVTLDETRYYTIDYKSLSAGKFFIPITDPAVLSAHIPWDLESLDEQEIDGKKTNLRMETDNVTGEIRYRHSESGEETPFSRYLIVMREENAYIVSSIVSWEEFGREKEVRLDTALTNWKD